MWPLLLDLVVLLTAAMVLGGAVAGGRVVADWPGLSSASLYEGRDLYPTADTRSMFKSILLEHLALPEAFVEREFARFRDLVEANFAMRCGYACARLGVAIADVPAEYRVLDAGRIARVTGVFLFSAAGTTERENQCRAQGQCPKCMNTLHRSPLHEARFSLPASFWVATRTAICVRGRIIDPCESRSKRGVAF